QEHCAAIPGLRPVRAPSSSDSQPAPETWSPPAHGGGHAPCIVLLTSGSTGHPKGVVSSHDNWISNLSAILESVQIDSTDHVGLTLPLNYSFGLSMALLTVVSGASLTFLPRMTLPGELVEQIASCHATVFAGVPVHYQQLLHEARFSGRHLTRLR